MLAESHDEEQIIARVAALDIGKAELVCCVRLPAQRGPKRLQEVSTHSTMTRSLTELASRLVELGVQRVVMEATSDYWKPVFYLLEAHGLVPWLVNARDVKHLPGRPKSDVIDAVWLCKLAERQMLRPSFVPPWPIRRLRDLTRYRVDLVAARTAEKNRVEKLLEDACIKLSVVASDIFGVSGRANSIALQALFPSPAWLRRWRVVIVDEGQQPAQSPLMGVAAIPVNPCRQPVDQFRRDDIALAGSGFEDKFDRALALADAQFDETGVQFGDSEAGAMLFQQLPCQVGLGRSIHASIFHQSGGYRTMRRRGEAPPFCGKGFHLPEDGWTLARSEVLAWLDRYRH